MASNVNHAWAGGQPAVGGLAPAVTPAPKGTKHVSHKPQRSVTPKRHAKVATAPKNMAQGKYL